MANGQLAVWKLYVVKNGNGYNGWRTSGDFHVDFPR